MSQIEIIRRYQVSAKKLFGQNFLSDPNLPEQIVDFLAPHWASGKVLEVGPGLGALSMPLLRRGYDLHAIEYDRDLAPILSSEINAIGLGAQFSLL